MNASLRVNSDYAVLKHIYEKIEADQWITRAFLDNEQKYLRFNRFEFGLELPFFY
jgi:hypothetical protein